MAEDTEHALDRTTPANLMGSGQRGDDDGTLIVSSKLHPPVPRGGTVIRRKLLNRLAESVAMKLTLVVGPAGWGKTTLLSDWCSSSEIARIAWFSIDQADNDPARFWAHFIAALNLVSPDTDPDAQQLLTVTQDKTIDVVVPHVINHFARLQTRTALVIDDYHLISNEAVHEGVEFLVEHLPPTLRLVLATRSDPALPLARLRGRGDMTEIRAEELRFTEAETAGLLNETLKLGFQPEQISVLQDRTEGWAAGVYLAGLSLRGQKDRDRQVGSFAGDNRQIVDYLLAEVLDRQAAHIRSFLIRTAVLDLLSGPLCDAVTGEGGSQRILEEMERSGLFIFPLDASRTWYRYHSLFADLLRRELDRSEPGLEPLLHRRASTWHRQHGSTAQAVGHALMASDLGDAGELIATRWTSRFNAGLAGTVESAACTLRAGTFHILGPPAGNLARLWAFGCLAAISLRRGELDLCEHYLRKATDLAARHGLGSYRDAATAVLTSADLLEESGEPRKAEDAAASGVELGWQGRAQVETVVALLCLASINILEGDSDGARARLAAASEVIDSSTTPGVLADSVTSTAHLAAQHVPRPRAGRGPNGRRPDGLTGREAQVFQLLAAGRTNSEIAAELVVSVHTVERHLQNGYRKVGVRNRGEAAAYIIRTAQL